MSPKWVRRALMAVMALAAFVLVIVGAAHTPIARDRAFDWVRARLERDLGLIVEADQLRYNVLTRSVSLENARLSVSGERPFLQARAIQVTLTRNLFRGSVELDRLSLEQPQVLVVRHDDGRTNLPASQSGSASSPSPIHLGLLSISALSLDVQDESAGSRIVAGPISLTIDTRAGMSRAGNFGPSPMTATLGSKNAEAPPQTLTGQFFGRLGFDGSKLVVEAMRLDSAEMRLGAEGQIDLIAEPMSVEAKTHIELDAARAGRLMGPDAPVLSGSAVADVTIRGPFDDPTVQAVINGQALRFQSSPDINLSAEGTYKSGLVDLRHVAIRSELGDLDASGSLALSESAGPSRLSTEITRADIDRLCLFTAGIASSTRSWLSIGGLHFVWSTGRRHGKDPAHAEACRTALMQGWAAGFLNHQCPGRFCRPELRLGPAAPHCRACLDRRRTRPGATRACSITPFTANAGSGVSGPRHSAWSLCMSAPSCKALPPCAAKPPRKRSGWCRVR